MTITRLHHVGHVVRDIARATTLYRRLGFTVPPPSCPALAPSEGADPEPFGAANTHADFPADFLELVTPVAGSVPPDAELVPLQAPPEVLPVLLDRISATTADLTAHLDRFEGLHILMLSTSDIDATAARLAEAGVPHGGVNTVQRPVEPGVLETVRYLELDDTPEGRVGAVADLDPRFQHNRHLDHPNGATGVQEAILCVDDLDAAESRYTTYLGVPALHAPHTRTFTLGPARLTLTTDLSALLPDEQPPALPGLAACAVTVRDLDATEEHLRDNGFTLGRTPDGDPFVPAREALGAAIIFRAGR
ncbi:VOC family protein [Saccharothrix sp. NPDC042600]|uniref:VOC family protein n=1 Tax=Saccharothrix TaxID=2071 RepID=UPI0033C1398D|nr:VOC family protein [Saccharothrix mutabilis subsp. capreolus]